MKKVVYLVLALMLGFTLAACTAEEVKDIVCETGQTLNTEGVCEDDEDPVVVVTDEIAPVLSGVTDATLEVGDTFDNMTGVTATDETDGDVTTDIVVTGTVNLTMAGTYTLTYTVKDAADNETTGSRTITVTAPVVVDVPDWTGYGYTVEVTGDTETVTYADVVGSAWWNNNAQLPLDSFDGTKDAVKYEFIGTEGHTYMFKIEGDGKNVESEFVVATGVLQSVTAPLTSLSETERSALNLLVLFITTGDASGTVQIVSWEAVNLADAPDTIKPTVDGAGNAVVHLNEVFDTAAGVTATDETDGDVTTGIVITGTVDVTTVGDYDVTYTVSDEAGNETVVVRTVSVIDTMWIGYGFDVSVDGANETIAYLAEREEWGDNAQYMVSGFDGTKLGIVFTFTGTVGHEYLFKAEGTANAEGTVVATGVEQEYTLSLLGLTETQRTELAKLVIFVRTQSVVGSITVAPWTYEEPAQAEWLSEGGITVEIDGDKEVFTYPINNGAWWDANAQYLITDFDGTKDAVVFTFTGTAGHLYVIKAEGTTNFEERVLATGVEQTFVLSLETLTEVQRDGIAKLVVFIETGGVEGTISMSELAYGMVADLPDTNAPTIAGIGSKLYNMNETFDQTADVTATDNVDGDLTSSIVITGTVDMAVAGEYTLTYTVTDAAGNSAAYTRVVTVSATSWLGYGFETELTAAGTELLSYPVNAGAWWDLNAQLKVSGFDGTKDQVVFTFTGTLGHEYLFKAEGNGFVEAAVVATGFEQSFVVSLSALTETQRNELSLFVLFSKTTDSEGMIEVVSWDYVTPVVTPDLFFSEYVEGSSNNKALEIYNPTGADVDLTTYSIVIYKNGASEASATYDMTGTLVDGDVFVICTDQLTAATECDVIQPYGDVLGDVTHFNGDDALAIVKDGVIIDVFGVIGTDPGSNWAVGTGYTNEFTLVRVASVVKGVTYWNTNEWTVLPVDTFTGLGSH